MIARIELKDGVTLVGNKYVNEMLRAVQIAFGDHGLPVATITSGTDGVHGPSSYHSKGRAVDVRFWGVPDEKRLDVALSIRQWLPAFYDVVTEVDHYHLEADADKEKRSH
jgi:hypothetical protein